MASMITELEIVPHNIVPGRKIQVKEYPLNNYQIHKCLQFLSRLILACLEGQSNNQRVALVPRDIRAIRNGFAGLMAAWQSAITHNDPPSGSHEENYKILLPSEVEIQKTANFKIKIMVMEFRRLASVMLGCDSAGSNGNIDIQSQSDIETQMEICAAEMEKWLGTGASNAETGMQLPVFKHLGITVPDVDLDFAQPAEPTADEPATGYPDVPDLPIGD